MIAASGRGHLEVARLLCVAGADARRGSICMRGLHVWLQWVWVAIASLSSRPGPAFLPGCKRAAGVYAQSWCMDVQDPAKTQSSGQPMKQSESESCNPSPLPPDMILSPPSVCVPSLSLSILCKPPISPFKPPPWRLPPHCCPALPLGFLSGQGGVLKSGQQAKLRGISIRASVVLLQTLTPQYSTV